MRLLLIIIVLLAACGCPRVFPADGQPEEPGTASHPWELPGWEPPLGEEAGPGNIPAGGEVELPISRGPALSSVDTFDTALLPGFWQMICRVHNGQMQRVELEPIYILEFRENGDAVQHVIQESGNQQNNAGWTKLAAGIIGFTWEQSDQIPVYIQFLGESFFYTWSPGDKLGTWFIRLPPPDVAPPQISANRFETDRGLMVLESIVGRSYEGSVTGETTLALRGIYFPGILLMRWEEAETGSAGYAALHVSPDWQMISGAWWLDDYEAAPFGGTWTGIVAESAAAPDDSGAAADQDS